MLGFTILAGSASADIEDPQADVTEIISQGMRSVTGDVFSQGMMADSGPWAGGIYSQGMEMATLGGTTNSKGTDTAAVAYLRGTINSSPPSQGCVGTAPNCTD